MCAEKSLACLENHLVVYLEKLINEEPCAIGAKLGSISVLEYPVTLFKYYTALQARKGVVIEFNITVGHSSNSYLSRALRESENLICLWAIQEL